MKKQKRIIISIILGIYLALVTSPVEWTIYNYLMLFAKFIVFTFIINKTIIYIEKINIPKDKMKPTNKTYFHWFMYIFIIMLIGLIIYYPENLTVDELNQYRQALTGNYNDWHPIIHTLIFYRLPTILFKSKLSVSLFHMIFVALVLLYFCKTLNKYGFNKYVITIILSLFILNPYFDFMAIKPIKDTAYSYCIFLLTLYLINIYLSNGEWVNKKINFIAFLLACFGITFFRHNGIGTFILVIIPMIFIYKNIRKFSILIFVIIISLRFIIIPSVYKLCGLEKTTFTFSETVCIMLNQISYIYNNNGKITTQQLKTLEKMQDLKLMKEKYDPYDYDEIKFSGDFYNTWSPYINTHKKEFFTLWYGLVKNNKKQAFTSYLYTTYLIWHIGFNMERAPRDMHYAFFGGNTTNNDVNYKEFQYNYFNYKKTLYVFPFSMILITVSTGLFLLLFSLLYCIVKVKEKLKLIIIYLPVLTNLLMILLMLPGREARFVYPNLICAFPLVILMLLVNQKIRKEKI